ncbi:hypothetical protein B0A48_06349 [Cryoendolithus antarcticus]|uniref:Uncharacterized protein n=1 Tax=Cryoendolithus antarcticus TaxID=1507870 RepID=A0A1V8TAU5_9PEZI|nr:hypothetical protein B0A48_06349 [Cryoendolithus antarcticus]
MAGPPVTPAKGSRSFAVLQDSPFSDYFTDDDAQSTPARSGGSSSGAHEVLSRMHRVQSHLLHEDGDGLANEKITSIVVRKLAEMENEIASLHSQSRIHAEDLFMDDEEQEEPRPRSQRATRSQPQSRDDENDDQRSSWSQDSQHSSLLASAQSALQALTHAQEELKARHAELVALNADIAAGLEERETQVEELRTENEALRSDLGFDHTDLLFLELQMRSLELAPLREELETDRLDSVVEAWRKDWGDVEGRFRGRREKYGVRTPKRRDSALVEPRSEDGEDDGAWRIEVKKEGSQRVGSLTLRRVSETTSEEDHARQSESGSGADAPIFDPTASQISGSLAQSTYTSNGTQTLEPSTIDSDPARDKLSHSASKESELEDGVAKKPTAATSTKRSRRAPARKTPIQELWQSLSELAGVDVEGD